MHLVLTLPPIYFLIICPQSPAPHPKPFFPCLVNLHNALFFIDTVHKYLLLWIFSSFLASLLCHMKIAPPDKPICSFPLIWLLLA